ncbi:phiSA1p31-related protein [Streptomyces sp. NBC_01511]|uniref:phiSA1p31-related protein n=1 Tax=Streptomyces sp. NBC_01511 TaxID=2903889 RepID=UPI00386AC4B3
MNIRLIDYDEHAIVVTIGRNLAVETFNPSICDGVTADLLRNIADQLDAKHPPYPCRPGSQPEQHEQHERPAEPLHPQGSTLDRYAGTWADGAGHTWDLTLMWEDVAGGRWRWNGRMAQSVPMMREVRTGELTPLDALRFINGPITPVRGEQP